MMEKKMFLYRDAEGGAIYLCELRKKGWSRPKSIKGINSEYQESSACFSPDEKTLYFVSNRPGGMGGKDIYMNKLTDENKWGEPVNLGSEINTPYDEGRVFMHPDGKTLYFSSKGHNTMGGYDIFFSTLKENDTWSKPQNIGYPVNTVNDDISFASTENKEYAYYSSLKPGGIGNKDIYRILFIDFLKTENIATIEDQLQFDEYEQMIMQNNNKDSVLGSLELAIANATEEMDKKIIDFLDKPELIPKKDVFSKNPVSIEILDSAIAMADSVTKEEISNLEDQVIDKETEITQLMEDIINAGNTEEIALLDNRIEDEENELLTLKEELKDAYIITLIPDIAVADNIMKDVLSILEDQVETKEGEITQLQEELKSANTPEYIANIESQIQANKNELTDLDEELKDVERRMQGRVISLTEKVKMEDIILLEAQLKTIEVELTNLQEQLKSATAPEEITSIESQIETKREELTFMKEEIKAIETVAPSPVIAMTEDAKVEEISELGAKAETKEEEITELQEQLKSATVPEEITSIESQIETKKDELTFMKEEIKTIETGAPSPVIAMTEDAKVEEISELETKAETKEEEITELQEQLKSATVPEEITSIESQI
ncbi:MAG: hypothetical protein ABII90_01685, partial [Bacteroidota bacterium]